MPNWCYAEMRVKGTPENKRKLYDLFLSQTEDNSDKQRYFARTWLNFMHCDTIEEEVQQEVSIFNLEVAWSVHSCMFEGYPQQNREHCPTILEVSKELDLELQIASEECGCCFREFYHIDKGELLLDECEDFPDERYDEEELYEKYLEEWNKTHTEGEPACFDEWLDCEYQELIDSWYSAVYEKFTEDFA